MSPPTPTKRNQAALKQMQNVLEADIHISTELDLQKISG